MIGLVALPMMALMTLHVMGLVAKAFLNLKW